MGVVLPNVNDANAANQNKPKKHDWSKKPSDSVCTIVLYAEQTNHNYDRNKHNDLCIEQTWISNFKPEGKTLTVVDGELTLWKSPLPRTWVIPSLILG